MSCDKIDTLICWFTMLYQHIKKFFDNITQTINENGKNIFVVQSGF